MLRHLLSCLLPLLLLPVACAFAATPPETHLLTNANVLPLALESGFEFRKIKQYYLGGERNARVKQVDEPTLAFERKRLLFGAVTGNDVRNRYGDYFTFFWRTKREADLTLRLEYRQQNLAAYVQAREIGYPAARGAHRTDLKVTGDDFQEAGRITAWRVLLIENHRTIVALSQSYLWR